MHSETVLRTNLVSWLQEQAALSFVFDRCSGKYHVNDAIVTSREPVFSIWSHSAHHVVNASKAGNPNKVFGLMLRHWRVLCKNGQHDVIERIDETLRGWGYDDFQFLDCGTRAFAFRTVHKPSAECRIMRVEAPHLFRENRSVHKTIAPAHHTIEGLEIGGTKIEICDELMPLSKIPDAKKLCASSPLYNKDFIALAEGTNMTYSENLYDDEALPKNVGLTPSGRVVSFDPQLVIGELAQKLHRNFTTPSIFRDASTAQLQLVYGHAHIISPQRNPL